MRRYSYFMIFFSVGVLAYSFESFSQNQSERQELLAVWAGMLPIILSAPHGGRQSIPGVPVRSGTGVTQFATGRDNNTDELAETIAVGLEKRLNAKPFLVVARFERKYLDANRPTENAYESIEAKPYYDGYHDALREAHEQVQRGWGRGLLLDIHGQGAQAEAIYRGTGNGKTVSSLTQRFGTEAITGPKSIFSQLERMGYKILPSTRESHKEQRYVGGYIVQTYGSYRGRGVDAIQLEIGTKLRARANLQRTATDLAEAIAVFAQAYLPLVKSSRVFEAASPP
ncbi:MAG TPA: N-formylglutamate amidohydrolase [Candidatus Binatia bacterium]|nr:N-formylglutamate amidohydrolase [Candidatus Binatia bacterium]